MGGAGIFLPDKHMHRSEIYHLLQLLSMLS